MGVWINPPDDVSQLSKVLCFRIRLFSGSVWRNIHLWTSVPTWHPAAAFDDNSLNKLPLIVLNCGHGSHARHNRGHLLSLLTQQTVCPTQTRCNKELSSQHSLLNFEISPIAVDVVDTSQSLRWPLWWLEKSPLHTDQPCVKISSRRRKPEP